MRAVASLRPDPLWKVRDRLNRRARNGEVVDRFCKVVALFAAAYFGAELLRVVLP